jgi:hypothetical protein
VCVCVCVCVCVRTLCALCNHMFSTYSFVHARTHTHRGQGFEVFKTTSMRDTTRKLDEIFKSVAAQHDAGGSAGLLYYSLNPTVLRPKP